MNNESSERRDTVRLAAWQGHCVDGDVEANLASAHRVVAAAGEESVDFLCLPETFLSGYGSRAIVERGALALEDPRLGELAAAAADRDLVLLIGLSERTDSGEIGNTVAIYSEGERLGHYRKTMLTTGDAREMGYCRDYDLPGRVLDVRHDARGEQITHLGGARRNRVARRDVQLGAGAQPGHCGGRRRCRRIRARPVRRWPRRRGIRRPGRGRGGRIRRHVVQMRRRLRRRERQVTRRGVGRRLTLILSLLTGRRAQSEKRDRHQNSEPSHGSSP